MKKLIYDLSITYADSPFDDQQFIGSAASILPNMIGTPLWAYLKPLEARARDLHPDNDTLEITIVKGLTKYSLKSVNG